MPVFPGAPGQFSGNLWAPTGGLRETFSRFRPMSNGAVLTGGRESLFGVEFGLQAGDVISTITFAASTTAGATLTNQWFRVRDSGRISLAFTADDGATAWAANTVKTLYVSRTVTDAAITSAANVVTSAAAAFTTADVGKQVTFMGAGAAAVPLGTTAARVTIASIGLDGANTCRLSANAGTTVASGGTLYIATPYTVPAASAGAAYLSCMVAATTVPTLVAAASASSQSVQLLAPVPFGQDVTNTGLTTPASAPGTSAALSNNVAALAYGYTS